MNLHYKINKLDKDTWKITIFANSDLIKTLISNESEFCAIHMALAYIDGFKFSRESL